MHLPAVPVRSPSLLVRQRLQVAMYRSARVQLLLMPAQVCALPRVAVPLQRAHQPRFLLLRVVLVVCSALQPVRANLAMAVAFR